MNQISTIALILSALFTTAILAEEPMVKSEIIKTSLDFSKYLSGPAKWKVGTKDTLSLKMDGDSTQFLSNGEKEVFRLDAPEYISEVITSDDGESLAFVAMESRGFGSDFGALILVQRVGAELKVSRALKSGQKLFEGGDWWLSELGAVSNDGKMILAKFGVSQPPKDGSSRMVYKWYTIELPTGKILSEGLTIANSKNHPKKREVTKKLNDDA